MIYLDNSATTHYKPIEVIDAVTAAVTDGANPGRSGHTAAVNAAVNVLAAREQLASIVDGDRAQTVLTLNCTHALNQAIMGTRRQGHVITTATEHNSVLRPLRALERSGLIRLTVLRPDPQGRITVDQVRAYSSPATYLVAVNLVSNVTGLAQDVRDIGVFCRSRGILFLCDGAQAAGYVPISVKRCCIDMLALAPHKGLHAPMGVGALIVSERVSLQPLLLGGTGTDSRNPIQQPTFPDGLEAGTLPYPAICAIAPACAYTRQHMSETARFNLEQTARLIDGLLRRRISVYSSPNASGVVSFNLPKIQSADVADRLDALGICVRGGLHCAPLMHEYLGTVIGGAVRASVSDGNTPSDIDALLDAVDAITAL